MLDTLKKAEARWLEIDEAIAQPGAAADQERYRSLMREYKTLTPIVEKFREYTAAEKQAQDAELLSDDPATDPELRALAEEEMFEARRKLERIKSGVGLLHHFPGNFECRVADVDTVAGFQVKKRHQSRCQQDRTGHRF